MLPACWLAGISALSDGRVMVTGGNSDYKTSIFDPVANDWVIGPQMNIPRGYQVLPGHPCPLSPFFRAPRQDTFSFANLLSCTGAPKVCGRSGSWLCCRSV